MGWKHPVRIWDCGHQSAWKPLTAMSGAFANRVIDGYRLMKLIGRGGFGEVWLCRSESLGGWHAMKFVTGGDPALLEKEFHALGLYRREAASLRSVHLIGIEHVNRWNAGLYYVMPLADGPAGVDPGDATWRPVTLASRIAERLQSGRGWFSSAEIIALMKPVLGGLQLLANRGLVHRDVKPDNILFFGGVPCLGDIGLLGEDALVISRRGTPGYASPSWYAGGHADMYGAAATLYTLLTGNLPDKMGRSAFIWPPGGAESLDADERTAWNRLHGVVRRATEENAAERFWDFNAMATALDGGTQAKEADGRHRIRKVLLGIAAFGGAAAAAALGAFRFHSERASRATENPAIPPPGDSRDLSPGEQADYQALAGMIHGYIAEGNYANALASADTLLATYPQSRSHPAYSIARAMALHGLGRIDEAKGELRKDVHLTPEIGAMNARKELWEKLGDLESAEQDIGRIIDRFGPATFPLFLRADIRARRGDFQGVSLDRKAALSADKDPEQPRLVEGMWKTLEDKYPEYRRFVAGSKQPESTEGKE